MLYDSPMALDSPLVDSKEVGLAVGLLLGESLFKMRDLHYGYWLSDQDVSLQELGKAQENYSQFLLSHVPADTRTVLDVGSGAGQMARRLLEKGLMVDCVSPTPYLTQRVSGLLGNRVKIFPCRLEDLVTDKRYDLVLFSESFQYVDPAKGLEQAAEFLAPSKHVIISDFFSRTSDTAGPLGGGHNIDRFQQVLRSSPFEVVADMDITQQTAPTIEVFGQLLTRTALPIRDLVAAFIRHRHPWLSKWLAWKFKNRINKINGKYFSGELNGSNFLKYKTYRFFLLKRK